MVAAEIESSDEHFHRYKLLEYVVMPNHVHLLVYPQLDPTESLHLLKGITARYANRILARTGWPFWQDETFDHWVRHVGQLAKIREYIASDPVRCGLAARAQDYPWSSAHKALVRRQERLVQRRPDAE